MTGGAERYTVGSPLHPLTQAAELSVMAEQKDLVLGQIAVEMGHLNQEQLQMCLNELELRRAKGQSARLEQILLLRGLIDNLTLVQLIREASWRMSSNPMTKRYKIERKLGEGGMAVVYLALDQENGGRTVALKLLKGAAEANETGKKRFEREGRTMAGLDHPNLVKVYDVGEADGRTYLAMEVLEGESFKDILKNKTLDLETLLGVVEKVCRAVHYAHEQGIIHRDLKPGNIMLTPKGEPKVVDFGLARSADGGGTVLTNTGMKLGTPLYMAPEQVVGRREGITSQTDIYALGAILYEVLVGHPPHTGSSAVQVYQKILKHDPVPPSELNPSVPEALGRVALPALEKEPTRRQKTAAQLADQIHAFLR